MGAPRVHPHRSWASLVRTHDSQALSWPFAGLHAIGAGDLLAPPKASDAEPRDAVRSQLERRTARAAAADAEALRGFDEAAARRFDWVAHTRHTYTPEQLEAWRTQVFRQKGNADDLALGPGVALADYLRERCQGSATHAPTPALVKHVQCRGSARAPWCTHLQGRPR